MVNGFLRFGRDDIRGEWRTARRAWVPKLFEPGWRSRGDLAKCPPYTTANGLGRRHAPALRNGNGPAGPPRDRRTSIRLRQPLSSSSRGGGLAGLATSYRSDGTHKPARRCRGLAWPIADASLRGLPPRARLDHSLRHRLRLLCRVGPAEKTAGYSVG